MRSQYLKKAKTNQTLMWVKHILEHKMLFFSEEQRSLKESARQVQSRNEFLSNNTSLSENEPCWNLLCHEGARTPLQPSFLKITPLTKGCQARASSKPTKSNTEGNPHMNTEECRIPWLGTPVSIWKTKRSKGPEPLRADLLEPILSSACAAHWYFLITLFHSPWLI